MAHKTKVNGTSYGISGGRTKINGTGYSISKGRTKVGGTVYNISFGTPASSLSVGRSIYFNVDGSETEFIVAHQGNPDSSIYDSSCNGTWVMLYDPIQTTASVGANAYPNSSLHTYLSSTFLGMLDSNVQASIKQVKIPYGYADKNQTVKTGSNGLSTKIFTLAAAEVLPGGSITDTNGFFPKDGAQLDYFKSLNNNDTDVYIIMRTLGVMMSSFYTVWLNPQDDGGCTAGALSKTYCTRPLFILPSDFDVSSYL